jgi:leader peptidase (prepilin peptidase)/N-methyltransferase
MSLVTTGFVALLGLFVAAVVWNLARNQAARRPLFEPVLCYPGSGMMPRSTWLPFYGFGTARRCPEDGTPQSSRRIIFELAVASYFGLAAWRIDDSLSLLAVIVFSVPLLIILLVDAWTRLIHTNIILCGVLLGWLFGAFDGFRQLGSSVVALVVAALVFGLLFFLAVAIYRNPKVVPFGLGDVYLAGMIGAMVRLDRIAPALLYGVFLAGVTLALLLLFKRVNRKQAVPYGPFLVLGALIVLIL